VDQHFTNRKVEPMKQIMKTKQEDTREYHQVQGGATFVPSFFLLYLFLENGWRIIKAELAATHDQTEFVYLVVLRSDTHLEIQQLILPKNEAIDKILAEQQYPTIATVDSIPLVEDELTLFDLKV
jgi:hypothetical protein